MNQNPQFENLNVGHPSPQRERLGLLTLGLGVFGVPLLWFAQMLSSFALSSVACYPSWDPLAAPKWAWLDAALSSIGLLALAAGLLISLRAWQNWRLTRSEHRGGEQHLLDIGEGRTRFLAMCGILMSVGFSVLLLFTTVVLLIVPPCGG